MCSFYRAGCGDPEERKNGNDGKSWLLQFIYSNEDFSILHTFSQQTHIITCSCWECDTQGNVAVQIVSLLIDSDAIHIYICMCVCVMNLSHSANNNKHFRFEIWVSLIQVYFPVSQHLLSSAVNSNVTSVHMRTCAACMGKLSWHL
jgi:hypothetical protein